MKKKIQSLVTLVMCLCLFVSMAAPASAAVTRAPRFNEVEPIWKNGTPTNTVEDPWAGTVTTPAQKAEANCYTSGSLGSAESTGILGGVWKDPAATGSFGSNAIPADQSSEPVQTAVNDNIKWVLTDGVLTLSGTGGTAHNARVLFDGNAHIETIVIEEGITYVAGYSFENIPNLKTVIIEDAGTVCENNFIYKCPSLNAVIVGTNLKDNTFKVCQVDYSVEKLIVLTKNIEQSRAGLKVRDDFNGYRYGTLVVKNGVNPYTIADGDIYMHGKYMLDDVIKVSYAEMFNTAKNALADVPASVLAKLPAELFAEHKEEPVEPILPVIPVEPVKPTEPVTPEETIPETMIGTNDVANAETHLRTSHSESNYVDVSISGNTLTVSGRLTVDGLTEVQVKCSSKKENIKVTSGELFSAQLTLSHSGKAAVNVYTYQAGSNWSITYNRIYIEKTANGYRIMPSLVQENNTAFEQRNIDPQATLDTEVPASVVAMSNAIVGNVTDDYTKVFLLHQWVAENIYYDYDAYYGRSQRITDSAGVLEVRRSVCEGYSRLLKDLILAQNIPAVYCTNMSTDGSYAISTSGGELHAHTEAYVGGRWIIMDATWDSNNKYRNGTYTTKAPAGYYYFDISSEAFAMDHEILSRGEVYCIPDENGFGISTDGTVLLSYNGTGNSVVIPDGVTTILEGVFSGRSDLASISIPGSMKLIDLNAFDNCPNLTHVYYDGTKEQWETITIAMYNDNLVNAEYHFSSSEPEQVETVAQIFADVPTNAYYAQSVAWAVEQGITNGTSATTFSPDQTCTTAQILTFLWRAYGSPEAAVSSTFTDVATNAYYSQAAQWAKEHGMVEGAVFSPNTPCTRASTVLYMWQAAGCPTVTTQTSFTDVPADADYAMAVAWAVEKSITNGTSATTFSPDNTCTRGQIATFLHRNLA